MSYAPGDMLRTVTHWHGVFDVPIRANLGDKTPIDLDLRARLLFEEVNEFCDAVVAGDMTGQVDACLDIIFVALGTLDTIGIEYPCMDELWAELLRSNFSKLGEDGKPIKRKDGKILKGPNYTTPDFESILAKYRKQT
jgi:predicted HAD superfamily Cof-like phosphohydrolase